MEIIREDFNTLSIPPASDWGYAGVLKNIKKHKAFLKVLDIGKVSYNEN